MIPPDQGPLPVRDATEAARYVRAIGLDPDLATVEGERWTVPIVAEGEEAVTLAFRYGDAGALNAEDYGDLSVALVRSVPTRFDLLGATYLDTIAAVVVEARACRGERLRLGAAPDRLDELLGVLADDVAAARAGVDVRAGDLAIPGQAFRLPDELRPLIPEPPFPVERLEALLAVGFGLVEDQLPERPKWGMLRHEDGAALMVRVVDDATVTKLDLVEGPRALEPWALFGTRLTPDGSRALRFAMHPALPFGAGLARARQTGLELRPLVQMDAGNERQSRFLIVDQRAPRRRQILLAVVVGPDDVVLGRWPIEGPGAVDQLARLMRGAILGQGGAGL